MDINWRKVKSGLYKADGPETDDHYTVVRIRTELTNTLWWYVKTGYGNAKEKIESFKTMEECRDFITAREEDRRLVKEARDIGVEIEKHPKLSGGSTVVGFMGGRKWTMMTRLRIDGEPVTDWFKEMDISPDTYETLVEASGDDRLTGRMLLELIRQYSRENAGERDRRPWFTSGGMGISKKQLNERYLIK